MRQQRLRIGFQVTGSPGARLRERSIERVPHDHHLTAVELAHPCRHDMHVHLALASGPAEFHIVAGLQLPSIVRETLPPPAAWIRRGIDAQPLLLSPTSGCISSRKCFIHCSPIACASHGVCARTRLSPARLDLSATCRTTPESVRLPSQSISPNSTITKYWYCGLLRHSRYRSAK